MAKQSRNQNPLIQVGVLGLGNLMRTDDAVGMLTLRRLLEADHLPPGVRFIEGGTLGLDLLDSLCGITHLLALDAVDTGAAPGTLMQFAGSELSQLPISKSVHLLGFADLLGVLRLLEFSPVEVILLGVQPESTGWGTSLSPAVAAVQDALINTAIAQITQWTSADRRSPYSITPHPGALSCVSPSREK